MVSQPHVGVCILRVEQQQQYLLITVTVNRHLGRTLTSAQPDSTVRTTDPAEALRLAKSFLDSFP